MKRKENSEKAGLYCACGILAAVLLAGCGQKENASAAANAAIVVEDLAGNASGGGSVSQLPRFTSGDGTTTVAMDELNEIIDGIRSDYDKALDNEYEDIVISTGAEEDGSLLQTTIAVTDQWISLTGREHVDKNLKSLAYDKDADAAITCVEALESAGISGVSLSQNVEEALTQLQETDSSCRGNLRSTEMQGFLLGEDKSLLQVYMKLEIDTGEEDLSQFFFIYTPADSSLTAYNWPE